MPRRLALVELDTSHPGAFVPLVRELGLEVAEVFDSGAVRPPAYAGEFAERHGIPTVATTLADLTADVAMLLGCDWDQRYEQACTLLDAGMTVLLDKPVAGRVGDLRDLAARAAAGQPVGGGSSFRCLPEAVAWRERGEERGEAAALVLVGCAGHPFYYGVHAVSFAEALLGPGFTAARALDESSRRGLLRHASGAEVLVDIQDGYPYFATVATASSVEHLRPDPAGVYKPFLAAHLQGDPPRLNVEPELMLLALAHSAATGGDWVDPESLPDSFSPWDAAAYTAAYRPPA